MKQLQNESLKKHCTFKVGGQATCIFLPQTEEDLSLIIEKSKGNFIVLGSGSNILFSDAKVKKTVIKTSDINHCRISGTRVTVGAGLSLSKLVNILAEEGLSGLEFLAGIPGTVGGAVAGNAGAWRRAIGEKVLLVKVFTNKGKSKKLRGKSLKFSYRKSNINGLIYEVTFKLKEKRPSIIKKEVKKYLIFRKGKHPKGASAGSIFINPIATGKNKYTAGELIEMAGLKGLKVGGAEISKKHGNFIMNTGKTSAKDIRKLIKHIQKIVYSKFKISLKPEVIIID